MKLKNTMLSRLRRRVIFCFIMFVIGIIISFKSLEKYNIKIEKKYNQFLIEEVLSDKTYLDRIKTIKENKPSENVEEAKEPLIYIYNTHDTEEYASNNLFSFVPNVTMVNYILKEKFEQANIQTIVEERSIKEILNKNNWNYASSYKASRLYIDDVKDSYPSIKYYIDVHRDSLEKAKTTTIINDKSYAQLLFIVGLENDNYKENLDFTQKIVDKLNERYPGLCKGIYKKSGPGVNGIYNQDVSPNCILAEFGGQENTIYEVLNTTLAFYECFLEVISE